MVKLNTQIGVKDFQNKNIPNSQSKSNFWIAIKDVFYEYTESSKVNGLHYLKRTSQSPIIRIIWIIIPVSLLIFGGWIVFELVRKFFEIPTIMILDTPTPVSNVPFPAITFCHPQTVLDYKAQQFVNKIIIPPEISKQEILNALPALGAFVENRWGHQPNPSEMELIDLVFKLNNYTISTAVLEVGLDCEDFIKVCAWARTDFPCFLENSPLRFTSTKSYLGVCCSFNYHPNNESHIPYHAKTFGVRGGLSLIGTGYPQIADGKSGSLFSSGFIMLIHNAYDFPVEGNPLTMIGIGYVTSVAVYPTLSHCSDDVLALPARSRHCIKDEESTQRVYRQPDCSVQCTRDVMYRICGCHPFHFPVPLGGLKIRECTAVDALCFSNNYLTFKRTSCVYCMPSCTDVTYITTGYSNAYNLRNTTINISPMYRNLTTTTMTFTTHVYLASQVASVQKQVIATSFITLLSNFGGVFNLCLGISLLSIVELIFYFGFRLPLKLKENNEQNIFNNNIKTVMPFSKRTLQTFH